MDDHDLFDEDDIQLIENPNDLGVYKSCDNFLENLNFAIGCDCSYSRLFIVNTNGTQRPLNTAMVELDIVTRQKIQTYLADLDENDVSTIFTEATNNGKIIESKQAYFIILDPSMDAIQTPDPEDNYIPIPKEPFLAFAKPSVLVNRQGDVDMRWVIDDIKDIDLSGKGITLINHLKSQIPETKLNSHTLAAQ